MPWQASSQAEEPDTVLCIGNCCIHAKLHRLHTSQRKPALKWWQAETLGIAVEVHPAHRNVVLLPLIARLRAGVFAFIVRALWHH